MKLEQIDQSIVVVADRHNPSILHPSFLEKQGIIMAGLELAEPALSTSEISIASFKNGLRFSIDNTRLQVTNSNVSENEFDLAQITSSYVKELPHVGYKSVGCNIFLYIEHDDAESFLIDKFIKHGPWNESPIQLKSTGLRFVYSLNDSIINISYDAGVISKNGKSNRPGILIRGNYHNEVSNVEGAVEEITRFDVKINVLVDYITKTFGEIL
jgi:hypothetical protein